MSINKIVYLPIELRSRELDAKLLLALNLVKAGYKVLIGQQWEIYRQINHLPKGIILFKSHNKIAQQSMLIAKNSGHKIFALEEESMALCTFRAAQKCSTKELYDICDFILTNGDFEKSYHQKFLDLKKLKINLFVVGNPRIDLLKHKFLPFFNKKINEIHKLFGKYILINTNFGTINGFMGDINVQKKISIQAGVIDQSDSTSLEDFEGIANWEKRCLKEVYLLVENLSRKFKDINIIIRPHPAENVTNISQIYSKYKNVKVIREGSHLPWTLGAELIIHTSCTTGLEAHIAGKTAFCLNPEDTWYTNSIISNKVNKVFRCNKDLVYEIDRFFKEKPSINELNALDLSNYIFNVSNNSAISEIINLFEALVETKKIIEPISFMSSPDMEAFKKEKCGFTDNDFIETMKLLKDCDETLPECNVIKAAESLYLLQ